MPSEPLSRDDLLALGWELVAQLEQLGDLSVKESRVVNAAHLPVVAALTTHVHRLSQVVLELHKRDLALESIPTVRSLFECSLTAAWLSQSKEGLAAFSNEDRRWRKNLGADLARSASEVLREGARTPPEEQESAATGAEEIARHFNKRCEALSPAGADAYVYYRILCAYSHPSMRLVDRYVEDASVPGSDRLAVTILRGPDGFDHFSWLYLTVASMVWAGRALDVMLLDHPHREFLRAAARRLGVVDVLTLTPEAEAADERARQSRRQAEWKGRRRR